MTISLADSRVLIVDDNEFNRKSLAILIRRHGIANIAFAGDGVEGLAMVESFKPDLVLLDVAMPNMNGIEMCRHLRENSDHTELPILFQTAHDSDEEQVNCFTAGGSDFISKPIKPGEFMARVRHQLERRKLFLSLADFRSRVEHELRHAQAMQLSLLPEPRRIADVAARHGLGVRAHFETSSELGGDLWSLIEIDDNRIGFLIVDFAGHGITAAINTFRFHTLLERVPADRTEPAEWLAALNLALKEVLPTGQFATAFYGVIDRAAGVLRYAGAGAPNPVLVCGERIDLLDSAGFLLGMSRRASYQTRTIAFPPGTNLFLYSDALTECPQRLGRLIENDQLGLLILEASRATQDERLPKVLDACLGDIPRPLRDDLTVVWIERRHA